MSNLVYVALFILLQSLGLDTRADTERSSSGERYRKQESHNLRNGGHGYESLHDTFHLPKLNHTHVDGMLADHSQSKSTQPKSKVAFQPKRKNLRVSNNLGGAVDEDRLFKDLFGPSYSELIRPVLRKDNPVQVVLGIAYVQLINLNEREQTLKSNVWIRQTWKNEILTWDPKRYGGITKLTVTKDLLWLPDLILHGNAGDSSLEQGLVESSLTKIEITHDGNHKWYSPVILTSSCPIDIRYFPFDNQKCILRFGSWTHASDLINLTSAENSADTKVLLPSTQFRIVSIPAKRHVVSYSADLAPFTEISFEIFFERLPGFYVFNVIIPSVAISVLCVCVFAYPEDNSGRVGFLFACLLSLFVVAMMIASAMPVNSDHTPLIALFIVLGMAEMTMAGIINVFVLVFYKEKGHEIPNWMRNFFFKRLAPLMRVEVDIERFDECRRSRLTKRIFKSAEDIETPVPSTSHGRFAGPRNHNEDSDTESMQFLCTKEARENIVNNFDDYKRGFDEEYEGQYTKDFWKCVSDVVDRLFFIAFVVSSIVSTIFLYKKIPDRMGEAVA